MTDTIKPRLKMISKRDFDSVKGKYTIEKEEIGAIINKAQPLDVLALSVIPGSGLKILDVRILNDKTIDTFLTLLKEGATISQ